MNDISKEKASHIFNLFHEDLKQFNIIEIDKEINDPNRILETLEKARKEGNTTTLHRDLETTQIQLKNRDKQKERVWKAFELTGDESTFHSGR